MSRPSPTPVTTGRRPRPSPLCDTCARTGVIHIEGQIGAPGTGGYITCPDCAPNSVQQVDYTDAEHLTEETR